MVAAGPALARHNFQNISHFLHLMLDTVKALPGSNRQILIICKAHESLRELRDWEICHWNKKHPVDKRIFPGFWFLSGARYLIVPRSDNAFSVISSVISPTWWRDLPRHRLITPPRMDSMGPWVPTQLSGRFDFRGILPRLEFNHRIVWLGQFPQKLGPSTHNS